MYSSETVLKNFEGLLDLPFVKKLIKKNKKLKHENKVLKSLIYSLPEFRCECKQSTSRKVEIKEEKDDSIPMQCEPLAESDEVVYVAPDETRKINITYVIEDEVIEEEEDEEEEEEAAEAAVEEEEEEAEEEEEEAEEEEAEEEEAEEEEAEEEEAEEEEEAVEEDAEEVFVVTVSGKSYYTTDKENGKIYAIDKDEEIGDEIGEFKKGKATFYKK